MKVEARFAPGIYALNRFLITMQNKRMPVTELDVAMREEGTTASFTLDTEEESARRYMILLENLEDVETVGEASRQ